MKQTDRDALKEWQAYIQDIANSTAVDPKMTQGEIEKHRIYLEKHPIEWIQFFFPKYAKYEFADFHKRAINRIMANDEWYEVWSWSRELAKSTIAMFCVMYLVLTRRKRNVILTSNSNDNADRLLAPYKANFEANARITAYYGEQVGSDWTDSEFITKGGASFRAVGILQSPRGSRNEEVRPDVLLPDDVDTDADCQNPDTVDKHWRWFERALYGTRSISEPLLVLWCGNIIAKDCCIVRAGKMANHHDIVNIRDSEGRSTWPQKNTEEFIDRTLKPISTSAQQAEYFNNPISEGTIFKTITYGKIPPLNKFKFLVIYGDPAPGENKTKASSTKGCILLGKLGGKLYVIKPYLDRGLNSEFIQWYIDLDNYVGGRVPVYKYMENNKLQDPFFQQVFKPLVAQKRKELGISLYIQGDEDKKTEKGTRIDANLEPLNREGHLIFNEAEQNNPHMMRLVDQFKLFDLRLKFPADGPDCVEGGNRICNMKLADTGSTDIVQRSVLRKTNKHRL